MTERLQKYLSRCGIGSRRTCEQLITGGRISVNGRIVKKLGTVIDPDKDSINFNGNNISPEKLIYIALNKPKGYVSAVVDKHSPVVIDLVNIKEKIFPVGRLDKNSTGLLLLTNDGEIAFKLTHPKYGHLKVYKVKINGRMSSKDTDKLFDGVMLEEGEVKAKSAKIISVAENSSVIEISIGEGRKRQIRRMFDAIGFKVMELERIQFGTLLLGNIFEGKWRYLTCKEVNALK